MMMINSYNSLFHKPHKHVACSSPFDLLSLVVVYFFLLLLQVGHHIMQERVARQISVPFLICASTHMLVTICDLAHICFTSCFLSVSCMKAFNKTRHTPLKNWYEKQTWMAFKKHFFGKFDLET